MNPRPRHYEERGHKGETASHPLLRANTEGSGIASKLAEHSAYNSAKKWEKRPRDLYFLFNRYTGLVKIGRAINVAYRIRGVELACGTTLDVLGILPCGGDLEADIHLALFETREIGEWFRPTPELLDVATAPTRDSIAALCESKRALVEKRTEELWSDPAVLARRAKCRPHRTRHKLASKLAKSSAKRCQPISLRAAS